jgi:peptidoglycan hydrolase CwlO-like protein
VISLNQPPEHCASYAHLWVRQ